MPDTSPLVLHPSPPAGLALDGRIAWLAGRQHGLVTRAQLEALDVSRHQLTGRVSRGLLLRIHRAVYALGVRPSSFEGRVLAAVLAGGDDAVASHRTAATLHGMLPARNGPVHVTTPPPPHAVRGVALHTSRSCRATASTVSGIPCAQVPRTLVDVAGTDGSIAATRAWSTLAGRRGVRPRAIEQELRTHPGRPGSVAVRALLEGHRIAVTGRTRSQLEDAALHLCATHCLPRPRVNQLVRLEEATYEADLLWDDARLIVELDGWTTHRDVASFRSDRRRDFDFDLAGWSSVRLLWDDITIHAAATAERLRRRLVQGR